MKRALQEKGGAGGCSLCNVKDFSNSYILIDHFGLNVHVKNVNSIFVCIFSPNILLPMAIVSFLQQPVEGQQIK